jgi:acyl dehydratase
MTLYFEDFEEGAVLIADECVADRDEMIDYAQKNDPLPFHVDEEAAKKYPYGGLIASGGYTVSLWYRSGIRLMKDIAFLGGSEWHVKFLLPVRPRDRLRTEVRIVNKRRSSKPGRGYVATSQKILNQENQVVFTCDVTWTVATRSSA